MLQSINARRCAAYSFEISHFTGAFTSPDRRRIRAVLEDQLLRLDHHVQRIALWNPIVRRSTPRAIEHLERRDALAVGRSS